jgi:hypothetical protein
MIFCSTRCRQAFHNRRLRRIPLRRASGQGDVCNAHFRGTHQSRALCWQKRAGFTFSAMDSARPVLRVYEDGTVRSFHLLAGKRKGSR